MAKIAEVINLLETWAPVHYQEDYDNSGLIVGNAENEIKSILITLDVTEEVIKEAISKNANLIIAHHPIIFKGIKKLNGKNYIERTIILAVKNEIAIYACHTNLDHVISGVNLKIAEKLGLKNVKILSTKKNTLLKLVTYVPTANKDILLKALFDAGAGNIGNYKKCSFSISGEGSFTPKTGATPVIGKIDVDEKVEEAKIEVVLPVHLQTQILKTLFETHPYEEVAYFLTKTENENQEIGAGAIGELSTEMNENEFLAHLKKSMALELIKYTPIGNNQIKKVAICGGAGSFLLKDAISNNANAFVTADYKYHEFFDAENKILIADIGHYESEVFTKELIHFKISNNFSTFATLLSETNTNPIKYFK